MANNHHPRCQLLEVQGRLLHLILRGRWRTFVARTQPGRAERQRHERMHQPD